MRILCVDAETFFDSTYTLTKETTESYIRHPRFECMGFGLRWLDGGEGIWVNASSLSVAFAKIDWANTAVLAHNAQFDGLILSHHYGVRPKMWLDTLSMARAVRGNHLRASLGALAKDMGLEEKSVPYDDMRGVHWCNMSEALRERVASGCLQDVNLTIEIFKRLLVNFPPEELNVISTTIKMFTEPRLIGDVKQFRAVQGAEWTRKNEALLDLGVSERDIQSSARFVQLLEAEGVEVETKKTKTAEAPAVAASDFFMQELLEDPNPRVAALAAARLDLKSTIEETRAGRLAAMAERGPLTVQLNYAGAHTLRWSGAGKVNFQNLPRDGGLRTGVCAPPGHKLVIVDLAQIECRVLNWIAGNRDLVRRMAAGEPVYASNAERLYGRPVTKKDDLEAYTVGKKQELGCGYGMGWRRFKAMVYGDMGLVLEQEFAERAIDDYRDTHPEVVKLWRRADQWIQILANKNRGSWPDGVPIGIDGGRVIGPNGSWMTYEVEWSAFDRAWRRRTRSGWSKFYGAALVENIVQYLARIILSQAVLRVEKRTGFRMALSAHDEAVWCVPTERADEIFAVAMEEMTKTPDWLSGCPIGAEGRTADRYGE